MCQKVISRGIVRSIHKMKKSIMLFICGKEDEVFYIGQAEVLPPPLEKSDENMCILALGDDEALSCYTKEQARNQLISHNLRLVVYLAKKFENTGVSVEDLISIGSIGLIIKLATYASRCIENEILMYLRRNSKIRMEVSFDEPLNMDWDGNELLLSDILGTDEDIIYKDIETEVEVNLLRKALDELNPREKQIIKMRYGIDCNDGNELTQKEVADVLGISQSYISRLEKKIIQRLRKSIQKVV